MFHAHQTMRSSTEIPNIQSLNFLILGSHGVLRDVDDLLSRGDEPVEVEDQRGKRRSTCHFLMTYGPLAYSTISQFHFCSRDRLFLSSSSPCIHGVVFFSTRICFFFSRIFSVYHLVALGVCMLNRKNT